MSVDPTAWEISERGATAEAGPIDDVANVVPARASIVAQDLAVVRFGSESLEKCLCLLAITMRRRKTRPGGRERCWLEPLERNPSAATNEDRLILAPREDSPEWRMHERQQKSAFPHMPACRCSVCASAHHTPSPAESRFRRELPAKRAKGDRRAERGAG